MEKISIFKTDGNQNGEIELNPLIFNAKVNDQLLQSVLKAYAGNQRRGTADTKERKEVAGGKKPWKQKGTGRARQGSIRAPQWRGGGTVFGPTPRDYDTNLPKEIRRQALISALSLKNQEKQLMVLENLAPGQPKTKEIIRIIHALKLQDVRTLCVMSSVGENLKRASQNVKEIFSLKRVNELNAYHVLRRKQLVIEQAALPILEKRLLSESEPAKKEAAAS